MIFIKATDILTESCVIIRDYAYCDSTTLRRFLAQTINI